MENINRSELKKWLAEHGHQAELFLAYRCRCSPVTIHKAVGGHTPKGSLRRVMEIETGIPEERLFPELLARDKQ